jgi:chitinase
MKKMKLIFSFILIFSIATISISLFTKDIETAQAASTIQLKDKSLVLEVDHYKTLRFNGTTKKASWYSSNSRVASVSSNGKVFANHTGTATITASVGGKKLTCKVKVIYVKKAVTMTPGKTSTLTVAGTNSKITWASSNESIATVSKSGKVTAKAPGTATITAYVDGKELTSKITVLALNYDSAVLELNGTSGFIRKLKINDTTSKITWSSSNKSVATVSSIGTVTAKGTGDATITASVDGIKLTCKVKVLKITTKAFTLKVGETKKLKIYGTTSEITWYSNKMTDAIVSDNGVVTAKAVGGATITGYVDGRKVNARVTVVE